MWYALASSLISLYANHKAQQAATDSNNQALAAQEAANAKAEALSAPARQYLQTVVANGTQLTPAQQQYVANTRQQTGQDLSSRVGGRSATAIATKTATNVANNTTQQNQGRVDQANQSLLNPGVNGANLALAAGQNRATAAQQNGAASANEWTAGGNVIGNTIGSYASGQGNQAVLDAIARSSASGRKSAYSSPISAYSAPNYSLANKQTSFGIQ